jgi:hypothetical protein
LWLNFSEGFPDSGGVAAIDVDTPNHRVYAAAAGWARSGIYILDWLTDVKNDGPQLAQETMLNQNYPNPFNPTTTISFSLPSKAFVSLRIFDALGREEAVLVSGELAAGTYARQWVAPGLPSGVYFYRLQAGSFSETKRLVLIR